MISARDLESTSTFTRTNSRSTYSPSPEIVHLDDIDQLVELLDDLVQRGVIAAGDDRHARGVGILRRPDVQRVDIIAAAAEKPGHAGEHAEFIFHQN